MKTVTFVYIQMSFGTFYRSPLYTRNQKIYTFLTQGAHLWACMNIWTGFSSLWLCVCGSVGKEGSLSVITITDWVRAKVCDISQPSTKCCCRDSPQSPSFPLLSTSNSPSLTPSVYQCSCFTCTVRLDGCCSVTSTPLPLHEPLSSLP